MNGITVDLLARVRAGDRAAADQLVRRFEPQIRRYLARRLRGEVARTCTVDDLFQETQMRAFQGISGFSYRKPGAYLAWLYTIARHVISRAYRDAKKAPPPLAFEPPKTGAASVPDLLAALQSQATSPLDRAARNERAGMVTEALAELPERRRQALVLRYLDGLSGPEAAAEMGLKPDNFRVLLHRARKDLGDVLDDALRPPGGPIRSNT